LAVISYLTMVVCARWFTSDYQNRKVRQNVPEGNGAMLKSELIQKIATANPHLSQRDAEHVVDAILDAITDAMSRGERVEGLRSLHHQAPRIADWPEPKNGGEGPGYPEVCPVL